MQRQEGTFHVQITTLTWESTWDETPKTKLFGSQESQGSTDLLETNPFNSQNMYYVCSVALMPEIHG